MHDVAGIVEQRLDQAGPLVGRLVAEELADLGNARNAPGQVEVDAAQELAVAGQRGRLDPLGRPPRLDVMIDFRSQGSRIHVDVPARFGTQPTASHQNRCHGRQPFSQLHHGAHLQKTHPWK